MKRSWICEPRDPKLRLKKSPVMCYDHSNHFTLRDRYKRVRKANTDACVVCAEIVTVNDIPEDRFEEIKESHKKEAYTQGTLRLMANMALGRADELDQAALAWRKMAYEILDMYETELEKTFQKGKKEQA